MFFRKQFGFVWSVLGLANGKIKKKFFSWLHRYRGVVQGVATFFNNYHINNFFTGRIYTGKTKIACSPGLNCYSCPGAAGSCPIGAFQAVVGSTRYHFSYYVTGIMILFGIMVGRLICGFFCPFGWFQDLVHYIPTRKFSTEKLKILCYFKYLILFGVVGLLTIFMTNAVGVSPPYFCEYICPQGILEGGIPLAISNISIRNTLGNLFIWKLLILVVISILSVFLYRPFCKWLCPLGAFYALFNKVSFYQYQVNQSACIHCGKCKNICGMHVDISKNQKGLECIRCGKCIEACPTEAISSGLFF